jgi:type IV pilus assembly protein PilB
MSLTRHTSDIAAPTIGIAHKHTSPQSRLRLGERLVDAGVITAEELDAALREQVKGQKLGETLMRLGFLEEVDLLPFLAEHLGTAHVILREGVLDPLAAKLIPRPLAEKFNCLGLFCVRGTLTVAMSDPLDLISIDQIERATRTRVNPVLALQNAISDLIPRVYGEGYQVDMLTADLDGDAVRLDEDAIRLDLGDILGTTDNSPAINLVNYMILQGVRQKASDIHIEAGQHHSIVRFRVDGMLREVLRPRREYHAAIISRLKVMSKLDIAEHRLPQDGRMHVAVDHRQIDLRVSTLPTVLGEKAVLRILDRESVTFRLEELGIPAEIYGGLNEIIQRPNGLLLVTGPTGSGKTTTLYSIVELLKTVERNIVTVEDPVEYRLEMVNQVHANAASQLSFAKALRAILRQDPDVIMIGEIRDAETAETAIQAALTGHLVLSTLHTNDSASAITRLVDMGIAPYKIGASLQGVLAQRLARKICPYCKGGYYPSPATLDAVNYKGDRDRSFERGSGCPKCFDSGYQGRIGVYELMKVNRTLREMISVNAPVDQLRAQAVKDGSRLLSQHAIQLAEAGVTTLDEIVRVAVFE